MTYFSELPNIYYDFNVLNERQVYILKDISFNIRFQKEVLSQITLYDDYDIRDNESPELLSERIYGSTQYHWIIMLMNNVFNVITEWPLSSLQFQTFIEDKYGKTNLYNTHHYTDSRGFILSSIDSYLDPYKSDVILSCNTIVDSNIVTSSTVGAFANMSVLSADIQVAGLGISSSNVIKINNFIDSSSFIMSAPATNTLLTPLTFYHFVNPALTAIPVSNLEYESSINDSKRRIKLIHPSLIASVVDQLRELINVA